MNVEAAFRPGLDSERGPVDVGDDADDGEAEPMPAALAGSLGAESLERHSTVILAASLAGALLVIDCAAYLLVEAARPGAPGHRNQARRA